MTQLSVIIPVYNVEKYLSECLDSVINQTFSNIEIICVNDGSTDNSLHILEDYAQKDNRIKIVNKENGGLSSARNAGMEVATGKYFMFIDSDDYINSETCEKAMAHIEQADLVHFGIKVFGAANLEKRKDDNEYYRIKFNKITKLTDRVVLASDVSACNKIFKKSITDKNNITFPDGLYYEDAEFYFKYVSCAKTAYYLNEDLYNYRRSGESIMSKTFKGTDKAIHHLYIVKNIFNFWKNNHYLDKNEILFMKLFDSYFKLAYWNSTPEKRKEVLSVASEYAEIFSKSLTIKSNFIKNLKKKKYNNIYEPDLPFNKKILKKVMYYDLYNNKDKYCIYILGLRIRLKNKNEEIINKLNAIEYKINQIYNSMIEMKVK